ncbi:MAG TPA: adventurous gliding motility lipoprotein CglC [Anaeromyxobacteraceae bacterium]|nr:adventurous gliding motility lipoprotein CglC [Anaeromyxobacteraceae bacterium]
MTLLAFVAFAAIGSGCQQPDVGARCLIPSYPPAAGSTPIHPEPTSISGDYLETGNLACDSLVCIVSPATSGKYSACDGDNCGYCSKPCVSDSDCFKSETGLVCRPVVLAPEIIAELDPALAERYLGDARYSRYCAVPLD